MPKYSTLSFCILIFFLVLAGNPHNVFSQPLKWYKGNTHTHTNNSDGDSTPEEVTKWYLANGYNFLVLSDHNFLTKVDGLNSQYQKDEHFLLIQGEEVTSRFGNKPLHINGLNVERLISEQKGQSVIEVIQKSVDAIRDAKGIPHINHPNFGWAITLAELKQVENYKLFEIYNGHPLVNNFGGGDKPGLEEIWDSILTSGKLIYGLAVDDAHHFKRPLDRNSSLPGKGWIFVRTAKLSAESILEAMENGDFYSSTGVELTDYQANRQSIKITIKEQNGSKYRTQFIGKNGKILSVKNDNPAVYKIRGNEGYVRAKILESNGKVAWTQPIMLKNK